jgi:hypothetical protein
MDYTQEEFKGMRWGQQERRTTKKMKRTMIVCGTRYRKGTRTVLGQVKGFFGLNEGKKIAGSMIESEVVRLVNARQAALI